MNFSTRPDSARPPDFDVAVIGAGPAGLVAAAQVAHYGLRVMLLDKRTEVSEQPRAVGVSLRQMEVFRRWGLEEALRAGADDVDLALYQIDSVRAAAAGIRHPVNVPDLSQSAVVSPTSSARVPQDHLERVLLEHLDRQPSAQVRRGVEVVDVRSGADRVAIAVDGVAKPITAAWVVAADGAHSRTRARLGIDVTGADRVMAGVSAEFRAPLWGMLAEHRYALYNIAHPDGAGVLIPAGNGDRWQYGVILGPDDDPAAVATPEVLTRRIRAAAGDEELPLEIVRTGTFVAGATLATRFAHGRVFLAGDAAHRVSPRGGNGLAMAVRGGLAIGWRLAWVLRGWAPPDFLASYEAEIRPRAAEDVARSAAPQGRCHAVVTEMHRDLGGRIPHAWTAVGVSTLDLVTDGLTLFVSASAAQWQAAVARLDRRVPVRVVELDSASAHALALVRSGAALLVRPDGVPIARWTRIPKAHRAVDDLANAVDDLLDSADDQPTTAPTLELETAK